MADKAIHEMISAFTTGCMDKDNFLQFREYVSSGGDLPPGELGEFQNIISLIPSILELETPDPNLKEKVAKKLLDYKDEVREKIKQQKSQEKPKDTPVVPKDGKVHSLSELDKDAVRTLSDEEMKKVESVFNEEELTPRPTVETPPPTKTINPEPQRISSIPASESSGSFNNKIPWIVAACLIVGLVGFYFIMSSTTTALESEIDDLNTRIENLQEKVDEANIYIAEKQRLVDFIDNPDLVVVDLAGVDSAANMSGKLLMSFEKRKGIIAFFNLPILPEDKTFKLWMVTKGFSYNLGSYKPQDNGIYYPIEDIPIADIEDVSLFRVSIEEKSANIPTGTTVIYGSVYKGKLNKKK